MPGSGNAGTTDSALLFEQQCLAAEGELLALLQRERVEAARRAMLVVPGDFQWRWWDDATLELSFWLPAGKYALFTIPNATAWTIIFNKTPNQWGAFKYDQQQDALRVEAKPRPTAKPTEQFLISIAKNGKATMMWENTAVDFTVAAAK